MPASTPVAYNKDESTRRDITTVGRLMDEQATNDKKPIQFTTTVLQTRWLVKKNQGLESEIERVVC